MTSEQPVLVGRPGQMTAVMRAVAAGGGPKILRVAVVHGGRVVDERLLKDRGHVTIGPSPNTTFAPSHPSLPQAFRLFERVGDHYQLAFVEGMNGRIATPDGVSDLAAVACAARPRAEGGLTVRRVRLDEDARGKIVLGETTFLFQFVVPPPMPPRAQLPVSVKKGLGGDIDWFTTIVAAFSFLLHFFFVALVYSDWTDPEVDTEVTVLPVIEWVKRLPAPPPLDRPALDVESDSGATAATEGSKQGHGRGGRGASGGRGKEPGSARTAADAKAAAIASELAELDVQTLGALGGAGASTGGVLGTSDVPASMLDEAARSRLGAGANGAAGLNLGNLDGSSVRPGARGGNELSRIGVADEDASSGPKTGHAKTVEGPKVGVSLGGVQDPTGAVTNATAVVARMRARFRHCYEQGRLAYPEMQGSVTLTAKIGSNGEVVGVGGGGGSMAPIVPCLKGVVQGGQFASPTGGSGMVVIPIIFYPSNDP